MNQDPNTFVRIVGRLHTTPEDAPEVERLLGELVAWTRENDRATLAYDFYRSADGTTYTFHEAYAHAQAALEHHDRSPADKRARVVELCTVGTVDVYGEPSEDHRKTLDALNPTYHATLVRL
jgi:quinol monooxygenase YgiN